MADATAIVEPQRAHGVGGPRRDATTPAYLELTVRASRRKV